MHGKEIKILVLIEQINLKINSQKAKKKKIICVILKALSNVFLSVLPTVQTWK